MSDALDVYQNHRFTLWLLVLAVAFTVSAWLRRERRLDGMPGPGGYPLVGIGISLPPKAPQRFREWASSYGEVFKLRVGWYNWVVINSPEAFKEILDKQVRLHTISDLIQLRLTRSLPAVCYHILQDTSTNGGRCHLTGYADVHDAIRTQMAHISQHRASTRLGHHDGNLHPNTGVRD